MKRIILTIFVLMIVSSSSVVLSCDNNCDCGCNKGEQCTCLKDEKGNCLKEETSSCKCEKKDCSCSSCSKEKACPLSKLKKCGNTVLNKIFFWRKKCSCK